MSRSAAFDVVAQFEQALCEYTGAPYAVTTDSCTNALWLALRRTAWAYPVAEKVVYLPSHTYVGVVQAARNVGYEVRFTREKWKGHYYIGGTSVVDSAKAFYRDMYEKGTLTCLSFQAGKILPIGRGGAILTDNAEAADWLRKARLDGRTAGADYSENTYQRFGAHCYLDPPSAARGLWLMTYIDDGPDDTWEAYPDLSEAMWT